MPINVALLLLQLDLLVRADCSWGKELRVVAWLLGDVPATRGPIPPPAREVSRADQWWNQICGGHELWPCVAAGYTIALPPSCWGNVHAWGPPAFPIAPMGRQALAPEAGWEKVGAGRNTRLYRCFVEPISMSGLECGDRLFGERAPGCMRTWWVHVLPWPCSLTRHFRHGPVTSWACRCCAVQRNEVVLWEGQLVSLCFPEAGCLTSVGNIFPDNQKQWFF